MGSDFRIFSISDGMGIKDLAPVLHYAELHQEPPHQCHLLMSRK